MQIFYDSRLAKFKSKLGALKTDESTDISIFAQEVYNLRIRLENETDCFVFPMSKIGDYWHYYLTAPSTPGILFYSFIFEMDGKTFYLGADNESGQGRSTIYDNWEPHFNQLPNWKKPFLFQITVYDKNFTTPNWTKHAIMYQIFPDRFCRGNKENLVKGKAYHESLNRRIIAHDNWNETPIYTPVDGNEEYFPCDFFGGDLIGIEQQLDYLQKLSINVIYLNPICEASSNHRYDTADYMRVDPILGNNYDFSHLCDSAATRGIKIILDGVFSHTGSDSIYFNKNSSYPTKGAYQGSDSEFAGWYKFEGSYDNYKSWWGFKTLPEVDEENKDWQRFIITSKNGVFYNWLNMGAHGFRLDVADELPDDVIELMRKSLKLQSPENFLIGEVWEEATTKQSYGKNRQYALGNGLDSVMNYPFRDKCLGFLLNKITAYELSDFLAAQALNYPSQMYYSLMNLISSHDVPRAKTVLATGLTGENMTRSEQAFVIPDEVQSANGLKLLRLAAVLQFTIPGMPSIYYGDEQGLDGLKDPFNRSTFSYENEELADFFSKLATMRKSWQVLNSGDISFLAANRSVISILRFNMQGVDFFGNSATDDAALIIVNSANTDFFFNFPLDIFETCIEKDRLNAFTAFAFKNAQDIFTDEVFPIVDRHFSFSVSAQNYRVFKLN